MRNVDLHRIESTPDIVEREAGADLPASAEGGDPGLPIFVGIKPDSREAFETVDGERLEAAFIEVMEKYETLLPPDGLAAALRSLGIRCKTIHDNPEHAGPYGPDPGDYPGFRAAIVHFPGGDRSWVDPE